MSGDTNEDINDTVFDEDSEDDDDVILNQVGESEDEDRIDSDDLGRVALPL